MDVMPWHGARYKVGMIYTLYGAHEATENTCTVQSTQANAVLISIAVRYSAK